MHTASVAAETCGDLASAVEYMATVRMSCNSAVRIIRSAISPRFAISILRSGGGSDDDDDDGPSSLLGADAAVVAGADDEKGNDDDNDDDDWTNERRKRDAAREFREHCIF